MQVRTVKAGHEFRRGLLEQARRNVPPRRCVGGGREGGDLRATGGPGEVRDAQIVGAEVMAPLRDAMGFIHRNHGQPRSSQAFGKAWNRHPLGSHVEKPETAFVERSPGRLAVIRLISRGEGGGVDPGRLKRAHLVAHQGDKRGDDHGEAAPHQRRQLIAHRLSASGRHDGEHVAALQNALDDFPLPGPEVVIAEYLGHLGASLVELGGGGRIGVEHVRRLGGAKAGATHKRCLRWA